MDWRLDHKQMHQLQFSILSLQGNWSPKAAYKRTPLSEFQMTGPVPIMIVSREGRREPQSSVSTYKHQTTTPNSRHRATHSLLIKRGNHNNAYGRWCWWGRYERELSVYTSLEPLSPLKYRHQKERPHLGCTSTNNPCLSL